MDISSVAEGERIVIAGPSGCLRISRVGLVAFDVGLHIGLWHQPHRMAEFADCVGPVVGTPACFHSDKAWLNMTKEFQDL